MPLIRRRKLFSLPVQLIAAPEGVIVKRGSTEILIKGTDAARAVRLVLNATRGEGASPGEIRKLFTRVDAAQVDALIKNLAERQLLIPAEAKTVPEGNGESNLDVFFWNFGTSEDRVMAKFNKTRLVIIGVNSISRQLALSLTTSGYLNYRILDHPRHRNMHFFNKDGYLNTEEWPASVHRPEPHSADQRNDLGDCLVATSDLGSQQSLCEWNKICLEQKVKFLPVILKNLIGYVGPLVIPGETPCFECLLSRQRSHSIDAQLEHLIDAVAFEGQEIVGFHPSMATISGDIAAFEISRYFSGSFPKREPGQVIEVDLLAGQMINRTVLKVPRCAACSPLHKSSVTNIKKVLFPEDSRSP